MRYSVGSGPGPRCNSRYTRTCCATAAATPWRTRATTPVRCRLGSATRTSSTRCVTPNLRRIDLRTSGDNRRSQRAPLTAPAKGLAEKRRTRGFLLLSVHRRAPNRAQAVALVSWPFCACALRHVEGLPTDREVGSLRQHLRRFPKVQRYEVQTR